MQTAAGIFFRLRARAFVFVDEDSNRFAFVSVDCGMASQIVTMSVLEQLNALYGDLYTNDNVCISGVCVCVCVDTLPKPIHAGIHTHSGPGGYLQYLLFDLTSFGFVQESMQALVDGIVQAIVMAHKSVGQWVSVYKSGILVL